MANARDFTRITMTDLRARAGEIIDAAAEEGTAFLVERKGLPLACIVPVAELIPAISIERLRSEFDGLVAAGEQVSATIDRDRQFVFRIASSSVEHGTLAIRIVLPHGYPSRAPVAYADGVQGHAPHRWPDGALCLPVTMSWNPGKHNALSVLRAARSWLSAYEEWRSTQQWPGGR